MPTSSPSGAQLLHTEGAWEWCVLTTPDMGHSPHFPITLPSLTPSLVPMEVAVPGAAGGPPGCPPLGQFPRPTLGLPSKPGMEARPCCPRDRRGRSEGRAAECSAWRQCPLGGYGLTRSLAPQALTDPHSEDTREVPSSHLTWGSLAWPWGYGRRLGPRRLSMGRARLPAPVLGLVLSPGPDPASLGEAGSKEKGARGCLPPASTW